MTQHQKFYDDPHDAHFITISCNGRRKLLNQDRCKRIAISRLESIRNKYDGMCFGFVIMPEHAHTLVRFSVTGRLSLFMQEWKRQTSDQLVKLFLQSNSPVLQHITDSEGNHRVWIPRRHDFNIHSERKAEEKLEYMHNNPVRRGLCDRPEEWPFSSARWYYLRRSVGVELTSIHA